MAENDEPVVTYNERDGIVVGTVFATSMLDALNVTEFGNEVVNYLNEHPSTRLMLNFENVDYLSSAALTELLRINEAAVSGGGSVRLCGLSPDIYKVFKITNLDKLFAVEESESVDHAIRRFKRAMAIAQEEDEWDRKHQEF